MKRFVCSDFGVVTIAGLVGGVVVAATSAGPALTYVIALVLLVAVLRINFGRENWKSGPGRARRGGP